MPSTSDGSSRKARSMSSWRSLVFDVVSDGMKDKRVENN